MWHDASAMAHVVSRPHQVANQLVQAGVVRACAQVLGRVGVWVTVGLDTGTESGTGIVAGTGAGAGTETGMTMFLLRFVLLLLLLCGHAVLLLLCGHAVPRRTRP